jgi:hypothetical protein
LTFDVPVCALFAIPDMDRDLNSSASGMFAAMSFDTSTLPFLRFLEITELTKDSSKHPSAHCTEKLVRMLQACTLKIYILSNL